MVLPPLFGFPWERVSSPPPPPSREEVDDELEEKVSVDELPKQELREHPQLREQHHPDEYVLVLKRKAPPPHHLKVYQEKFRKARIIANDKTSHLKGVPRVMAINQIMSELMLTEEEKWE